MHDKNIQWVKLRAAHYSTKSAVGIIFRGAGSDRFSPGPELSLGVVLTVSIFGASVATLLSSGGVSLTASFVDCGI